MSNILTGYFGRAISVNHCVVTKVHAVHGKTGRPVCGSVIGKGMTWHFCSPRFHEEYVECERCKAWYKRELEK